MLDEKTAEWLYQQIDTQALQDAINAFLVAGKEAITKVMDDFNALRQAILDVRPYLKDVLSEAVEVGQQVLEIISSRDRERAKWRRFNAPKIRPLLLDKRSKVHRCRNAC